MTGHCAIDRKLRHIVDIDGQLIGFEHGLVSRDEILATVGRTGQCSIAMHSPDGWVTLDHEQAVELDPAVVAFFRSVPIDEPALRRCDRTAFKAAQIAAHSGMNEERQEPGLATLIVRSGCNQTFGSVEPMD